LADVAWMVEQRLVLLDATGEAAGVARLSASGKAV